MSTKRNQHHCPQCKAIAKPDCIRKGHMTQCPKHEAANSQFGECHSCTEEARREAEEKRKEGEKLREQQIERAKLEKEEAKRKLRSDKKFEKYLERQRRKSSEG